MLSTCGTTAAETVHSASGFFYLVMAMTLREQRKHLLDMKKEASENSDKWFYKAKELYKRYAGENYNGALDVKGLGLLFLGSLAKDRATSEVISNPADYQSFQTYVKLMNDQLVIRNEYHQKLIVIEKKIDRIIEESATDLPDSIRELNLLIEDCENKIRYREGLNKSLISCVRELENAIVSNPDKDQSEFIKNIDIDGTWYSGDDKYFREEIEKNSSKIKNWKNRIADYKRHKEKLSETTAHPDQQQPAAQPEQGHTPETIDNSVRDAMKKNPKVWTTENYFKYKKNRKLSANIREFIKKHCPDLTTEQIRQSLIRRFER
jgi:hypothetical protein